MEPAQPRRRTSRNRGAVVMGRLQYVAGSTTAPVQTALWPVEHLRWTNQHLALRNHKPNHAVASWFVRVQMEPAQPRRQALTNRGAVVGPMTPICSQLNHGAGPYSVLRCGTWNIYSGPSSILPCGITCPMMRWRRGSFGSNM